MRTQLPDGYVEYEPGTLLVAREHSNSWLVDNCAAIHNNVFNVGDVVLLLSVSHSDGATKAKVLFKDNIFTLQAFGIVPLVIFFRDGEAAHEAR